MRGGLAGWLRQGGKAAIGRGRDGGVGRPARGERRVGWGKGREARSKRVVDMGLGREARASGFDMGLGREGLSQGRSEAE